jgi:CheY-like chemotaxis protein
VPEPRTPHVVVLDGEPAVARAFGNLFAEVGYRVTPVTDCAVDPADVLALEPDVIVLDVQCDRGLRGLHLLRRLRGDPAGRDVPVVASPTSLRIDLKSHAAELRALGAVVLPEPFDVQDILVAARAAIAHARAARRRSDAAIDRLRSDREKLPPH